MPRPKGIGSRHKIVTCNNQGRQRTNHCDNRCFNYNDCHLKSKKLLSPMVYGSPPLNNSVINPSPPSSYCKQSSRSSHNTPRDKQCFNSKGSNSKSNYLPSPVLHGPPLLNDSVINPTQMSSVCHQSSRSTHNTTHELQASSIPGQTSPGPSNTIPPPSTNNVGHNIYGCLVGVSKLTPAQQQQQRSIMLLQNYHELCIMNDPSSMFVSPPPVTNIESLS